MFKMKRYSLLLLAALSSSKQIRNQTLAFTGILSHTSDYKAGGSVVRMPILEY